MNIEPLTPVFGAEIVGASLRSESDDATFSRIRQAFEAFGVILMRNQFLSDDEQIAFSSKFGPLERTIKASPTGGTYFARQSNLDLRTGEILSSDSRRMKYQKGNLLWHADSTFKKMPSLCSILTAREVPPEGGATEFASTKAAYELLSPERQAELDGLIVEHDLIHSRERIGFRFTAEEAAQTPPVRHQLVQVNPVTGRKSLMIGQHAARIVGWSYEEGRALLDELLELATRPENTFSHQWRVGDMIIWDNRAILHRATSYDSTRFRRLMQRTTISNSTAETF